MFLISRHLPDIIATLLGMAALFFVVSGWRPRSWLRSVVLAAGIGVLSAGLLLRSARIANALPLEVVDPVRLGSFMLLIATFAGAATALTLRLIPKGRAHHSPERRRFLNVARTVIMASPIAATGYGVFIQRDNFRIREVSVRIKGLDRALDGLRMVQVSDIHLSPFLSERELARVIDMANETRAHIALMTGDLITGYRDPLDACIRQVGRLRADAGVFGCLGNHETYARVEEYTAEQALRLGVKFLRGESRVLEFGGKPLNIAGVDYEKMGSDYLPGTERLVQSGMPNILLSHNPDVFPVAASKGFDLTVSGHTHGGQITFEILHQNVSIARFYTPYVYGLYEERGASAYVTRGIGTVGVPARLGAPPEVALIRLCAT